VGVTGRRRSLDVAELDAYDIVPRAVAARARVVVAPILPPGAGGMTLGRWILLRRDDLVDGTSTLIAHELVHARQWQELGIGRFLWRYLSAYARNLARMRRHDAAYRAIPLEVEAYELAADWARRRSG
jgi:hypothetical protein